MGWRQSVCGATAEEIWEAITTPEFTARYRHTLKGMDRGKWEVDVQAEADAPLVTLDQVIRGVMKRAGEPFEPEKISASAFRTIVEGVVPSISA